MEKNKEFPIKWNNEVVGFTVDGKSIRITNKELYAKMLIEFTDLSLVKGPAYYKPFNQIIEERSVFEDFSSIIGEEDSEFDMTEYGRYNKRSFLKRYKKIEKSEKGKDKKYLLAISEKSRKLFKKTMKYELSLYRKFLIRFKDNLRRRKQNKLLKKMEVLNYPKKK